MRHSTDHWGAAGQLGCWENPRTNLWYMTERNVRQLPGQLWGFVRPYFQLLFHLAHTQKVAPTQEQRAENKAIRTILGRENVEEVAESLFYVDCHSCCLLLFRGNFFLQISKIFFYDGTIQN